MRVKNYYIFNSVGEVGKSRGKRFSVMMFQFCNSVWKGYARKSLLYHA